MKAELIRKFLTQTEIIRQPRHALATFGATSIEYRLVSPVADLKDKTRLREGKVLSQKPQILTAESLRHRFEGFGDEAKDFADWIHRQYGEMLRAIEYNFRNQGLQTRVVSEPPRQVAERISQDMDSRQAAGEALIFCPDAAWSLALMKFALDESTRSFPTHMADMERRGLFSGASQEPERRKREIEALFSEAAKDRTRLDFLGRKLREYGLFSEYEERFLGFF